MSLYTRPLTSILAQINASNGLALLENQYTYSTPSASSAGGTGTNTKLTITSIVPDSPYQGPVDVFYQRLSLADLVTWLPSTIRCNLLSTVGDFVAFLKANFGLYFDDGDISNVTDNLNLNDGAGTVTLIASPNSMGWIGQGTFTLIKGNYQLPTYLAVTNLPGLMYPLRDETRPFAEVYSYWRDFTPALQTLNPLTTSTTDLTPVLNALKSVTGDAWTLTGKGRYSLGNATITYNGPVTSDYNPAFVNCCVVQLDPTQNLGYSGALVLHYGHDSTDFEDWGSPS